MKKLAIITGLFFGFYLFGASYFAVAEVNDRLRAHYTAEVKQETQEQANAVYAALPEHIKKALPVKTNKQLQELNESED